MVLSCRDRWPCPPPLCAPILEAAARKARPASVRPAPAQQEMITMMFWYGNSWAWWQAGLMWVAMIAFWGAVIWAAYAVITNLTRKPGTPDSSGDARSILDQRLARGEVGPEQYQRLRGLIGTETPHEASRAPNRT